MALNILVRVLLLAFVVIGVPLWIIPSDMNPEPNVIMILLWLLATILALMPFNAEQDD